MNLVIGNAVVLKLLDGAKVLDNEDVNAVIAFIESVLPAGTACKIIDILTGVYETHEQEDDIELDWN